MVVEEEGHLFVKDLGSEKASGVFRGANNSMPWSTVEARDRKLDEPRLLSKVAQEFRTRHALLLGLNPAQLQAAAEDLDFDMARLPREKGANSLGIKEFNRAAMIRYCMVASGW
mgnify:CR=1 FL=1